MGQHPHAPTLQQIPAMLPCRGAAAAVQDAQCRRAAATCCALPAAWAQQAGGTLLVFNPAACSTTGSAGGAAARAAAMPPSMQRSESSCDVLCNQGSMGRHQQHHLCLFHPSSMLHHLTCRRGSSVGSSSCAGRAAQPGQPRPGWRLTGRCGPVAQQTCSSSWRPSGRKQLLSRSSSRPWCPPRCHI